MKTQQEIEQMAKDVMDGIVVDEDTYDAGFDSGYHSALIWVLGKVEL